MSVNSRNHSTAESKNQVESNEPAPIFGKWRYWYAFTAGSLLFYIVALTIFNWIFS